MRSNKTCTRLRGSLRDFRVFFWLRVFSTSQATTQPTHLLVTQTVGLTSHKTKYVFDSASFDFGEGKFVFAAALFKQRFGSVFFQQASFQVLGFFVGGSFFVGMVSGCLCQVAEIGFKVFGLRFSPRWFWLVVRFPLAVILVGWLGLQNRLVFVRQKSWQKYKSLFFSKHFGLHKISSLRQSVSFGVLIGAKLVFQQAFWLA